MAWSDENYRRSELEIKLEMCQYDTDALPRAIFTHKKWSWKKGHNSHNNWQILP